MDYDSIVELDEMPCPFELQRGTLHNRGAVVWRVVSEGGQRMKAAFTMLNADIGLHFIVCRRTHTH